MANKDHLQIPEAQRGEVLATASVDRELVAKQSGGFVKGIVIGVIGVAAGIVFVTVANNPTGWFVVGIFGLVLLISAFRIWTGRQQVAATDEDLIVYQVRSGGVLIPSNFFIPWDEITGFTYESEAASAVSTSGGVVGVLTNSAINASLAKNGLDNAKRIITVNLADYKTTNARSGGNNVGMLAGPFLGFPGTGVVTLSGTVNDEVFTNLLEVTKREAEARGKTFARLDRDAEAKAAEAAMKAAKAAKKAG